MKRPSSRDAWIGCVGALGGALIAGFLSLVPWLFEKPDPLVELRRDVGAGIAGLSDLEDPESQLRQIAKLEALLKLDPAVAYLRVVHEYRSEAEPELERVARAQEAEEQERIRIAQLEAARLEAASAAEAERLRLAEEAARRAVEEAKAAEAAARAAAQAEAERRKQELAAENARRQAAIVEAQRALDAEKFCRDANCTSWILR